jgi:hypothetical protein
MLRPGDRDRSLPREGISMRYSVVFMAFGERQMTHVEAPDAAAAVAAVEASRRRLEEEFELLLVTPDEGAD